MVKNYFDSNYEDLKLILDLSYDLITISDGNGIFTAASKSCEQYFGMSEKQLIGMSPKDLESNGVFDKSITAEVVESKKKVTMIQKTASGKILLVTAHPVFNERNELVKILSFSKNITEERILSKQLNELQGEIEWYKLELNKRKVLDDSQAVYLSNAMNKVVELIQNVANLTVTVLLLGETGVGKSYFAKLIHQTSARRDEPFVTINCGAIPAGLLESELFGYEEGAFTGAKKGGKKGLFEIAGRGTIFLDEIGDMPMELQVKLLHTLDQKQIFRVGSVSPIDVEARMVAATNKDLHKMMVEGRFREDLYYRLNVVMITIPPLRERREEIPVFVNLFLEKYNKEYKMHKKISEWGYSALGKGEYAGNIRELEHVIERLVITSAEEQIDNGQIVELLGGGRTPLQDMAQEERVIVSLKDEVEKLERILLAEAFKKYKTTRKVGEALKIDQSTVVKMIKRLRIKIEDKE